MSILIIINNIVISRRKTVDDQNRNHVYNINIYGWKTDFNYYYLLIDLMDRLE